jgi:uncharacterized membrane protein YoaK (UPF0700 family)
MLTGMMLVSAMAVQNAAHRIHQSGSPPTTLMTGTTTQIMIDIADAIHGLPEETGDATRARLRRMSVAAVLAWISAKSAVSNPAEAATGR